MERLTYKLDKPMKSTYLYYEYMRIADYDIKRNNYGRITDAMIYNKLGKIEDFLEEQGFESLEELQNAIGFPRFVDGYDKDGNEINKTEFVTYIESFREVNEKNKQQKENIKELEEEVNNIQEVCDKYYGLYKEKFNRVLKLAERWQKLKEFVEQFKEYDSDEANLAWRIADKMQELEKE